MDVELNFEGEGVRLVGSPGWIEEVPLWGGCGTAAAGDHACSTTCASGKVLKLHPCTRRELGILHTEFGTKVPSAGGYHRGSLQAQHLDVFGQGPTTDDQDDTAGREWSF